MKDFLKIAMGEQENDDLFSEGHFGDSHKEETTDAIFL